MFLTYNIVGMCKDSPPEVVDGKVNTSGKLACAAIVADTLLSITFLVVGILASLAMIHGMSPTAGHALIGLSATITLTWALMRCMAGDNIWSEAKNMLIAPFSERPYLGPDY